MQKSRDTRREKKKNPTNSLDKHLLALSAIIIFIQGRRQLAFLAIIIILSYKIVSLLSIQNSGLSQCP